MFNVYHSVTQAKEMSSTLLQIGVKDNVDGIPQKVLDKIFQPFFTTRPLGEGTGLGLSLSYDLVKAHGGKIKIETKEARPPARAGSDGDDPFGR
ncbi:ATP-binding protein [Daejeonella sp.]|uniref:ATP-binding protein n=1 Tax=Daejeonella sp. TaxID=2805397 RepID=UPI00272FE500|nr:ATP-binding protein [Daejeonella sp.]MDP2414467.1 ATP-binding protein [Daejeonella sp.]